MDCVADMEVIDIMTNIFDNAGNIDAECFEFFGSEQAKNETVCQWPGMRQFPVPPVARGGADSDQDFVRSGQVNIRVNDAKVSAELYFEKSTNLIACPC